MSDFWFDMSSKKPYRELRNYTLGFAIWDKLFKTWLVVALFMGLLPQPDCQQITLCSINASIPLERQFVITWKIPVVFNTQHICLPTFRLASCPPINTDKHSDGMYLKHFWCCAIIKIGCSKGIITRRITISVIKRIGWDYFGLRYCYVNNAIAA